MFSRDFLDPVLDLVVPGSDLGRLALSHFELLEQDSASRTFLHPDRPGLVIRIGDVQDGWFGFAAGLRLKAETAPYGTRTFGMVSTGDNYLAAAERLHPIDGELKDLFAVLCEMVERDEASVFSDDEFHARRRTLVARHPGITGFIARHVAPTCDTTGGLVRMRDGRFVFHNPHPDLSLERSQELHDLFRVSR